MMSAIMHMIREGSLCRFRDTLQERTYGTGGDDVTQVLNAFGDLIQWVITTNQDLHKDDSSE
jgi:hypothetical protein